MNRFFLTAAKIGVGIALAVVLIGSAIWSIAAIWHDREVAANAPLSILKVWPSVNGVGRWAPATFQLRTAWRDGRIYYQFEFESIPFTLSKARESSGATFNVVFLDGNGFKILEKRIAVNEMVGVLDESAKPTRLDWKGDDYLAPDTYRSLSRWDLGWSGLPSAEEPTPEIAPAADATRQQTTPARRPEAWHELRYGLKMDQVRDLLGPPDNVQRFGTRGEDWYYGDGVVKFGSDQWVSGWRNP
jgi:hypothetical protein